MIDRGGDNVVVHLDDEWHRTMAMIDPADDEIIHVDCQEYPLAKTDIEKQ